MFKNRPISSYFKSLSWGLGIIIITFIKQILLVPVFLVYLGKDIFAFWLIANSILFVLRSIGLGLFNYCSNNVNLSYHLFNNQENSQNIQKAYSSCLIFFLVQLLLCFSFSSREFTSFITQFPIEFLEGIEGVTIILLLLLSKIPSSFVSLFFVRLYEPLGRIDKTLKFQLILELIDLLVLLICLPLTKSLFATVSVLFIANLAYSIFVIYYVHKDIKLKLDWITLNFENFILDLKKSSLLTLSFITEKVYDNGLNIVVAYAYSTKIVALFGTGRVLSNSALRFSNTISEPLMPQIQKDFASGINSKILDTFYKYWQVTCSLALLFVIILMPYLEDLFIIWTRNELEYNEQLIKSLFAAMFIQNYMIVIVQLLRRTNASYVLLVYNLIKVISTVGLMLLFKSDSWYSNLGLALFIGEVFSGLYVFKSLKEGLFNSRFYEFFFYFILIISSSLSIFLISNFYLLMIIGLFTIVLLNIRKIKNHFT